MSSAAPAAVTYFLQLARTTLPDYNVVFAKKEGVYHAPKTLQVFGFTDTQEPAELSPEARREENFDINCELVSWTGGEDFEGRMKDVMDAWALLSIAISTDFSLGNTVRWAQMTESQFTPDSDVNGNIMGCLEFKVNCQQRITSLT